MRILHVSDLHASEAPGHNHKRLVSAFLEDIAELHGQTPVDLVVFSGDLASKGTSAELQLGHQLLVAPLLDALGLTASRLVMVPGNHDVNRTLINKYEELGLAQTLTDVSSVTDVLTDSDQVTDVTARLAAWGDYYDALYDPPLATVGGLAHTQMLTIDGVAVGIAALNSAWRSSGADDHRKLIIGEHQITQALEQLSECRLQLVVSHHPLEWLIPFDESTTRRELETHNTIFLSGHEHLPEPSGEIRRRGRTIYSRAGCLYESADYPNSYSVLDVDIEADRTLISVRSWYVERGSFDRALHLLPEGEIEILWTGASLARPAHPPFNVVLRGLAEVVDQTNLVAARTDRSADLLIDDLLVPPRFFELPYREAIAAQRINDGLGVRPVEAWNDDWRSSQVLVLAGPPASGVTSALVWALDAQYKQDPALLPIYVPFDPRFSRRGLDAALDRSCRLAGRAHGNRDLPPLLIGIDDVAASTGRGIDTIIAYLAEHPEHKCVLGCHESEHDTIVAKLAAGQIHAVSTFLGPFGRRELRALIAKVAVPGAQDIIDPIFAVVRSQDLPRTPFLLAALVAVVATFTPAELATVNPSAILQSYVSLLLGRDDVGDREHLAMDFRRREHFLGSLASMLVRQGVTAVPRLEAEEYLASWFRTKGWGRDASPGRVLDSLIGRRLLVSDNDGCVGFHQPALLHFFTARSMIDDEAFREVILERPLHYSEAISHAAGLLRNSSRLLTTTNEVLRAVMTDIVASVNVALFDAVREQSGWGSFSASAASLERSLTHESEHTEAPDEKQLDDEHDAILDRLDASEDDGRDTTPLGELEKAVNLNTWVLRSSELVDDVQLKRAALKDAIRGWSLLAGVAATSDQTATLLKEFIEDRRDDLKDDPEVLDLLDDLEHFLRLVSVVELLLTVQHDLGTVHLAGVIDELADDEDFMSETAPALFITLLYFNSHEGASVPRLRTLYERGRDHPIVASVVRWWTHWAYDTEENRALRQRLEDLLVDMYETSGVSGREAVVAREAIAKNLRALRLRRAAKRGLRGGGLDELDAGPSQ